MTLTTTLGVYSGAVVMTANETSGSADYMFYVTSGSLTLSGGSYITNGPGDIIINNIGGSVIIQGGASLFDATGKGQ